MSKLYPDYEQYIEKVLDIANNDLSKAITYYSAYICKAPMKRNRINGYNKYTPQGQMTKPNPNFRKELTSWKEGFLFPFFLEYGFTRNELNNSWKIYKK